MATFYVAVLFTGMVLMTLALWGIALRVGLQFAKAPQVTLGRIGLAWLLVMIAQTIVTVLVTARKPHSEGAAFALELIAFVASTALACFIIQRLFQLTFLRAALAWLPTIAVSLAIAGFTYLILRPCLAEGYAIPTNSMAPTIMGPRLVGQCAQCGAPNYCSPPMDSYPMEGEADQRPMICEHFHIGPSAVSPTKDGRPDRLLTLKFIAPRRWDLVVFRYPDDPSQNYVKRLVGLPGETIVIRDGKVWADGQELVPPAELADLRYEAPEWHVGDYWGAPDRPAVLADDEYFMLGDFSVAANDARFWHSGAPGHPTYAVPRSYLVGVATHIYWPIDRWRAFR